MSAETTDFDPEAIRRLKTALQEGFYPVFESFLVNTDKYLKGIESAIEDSRFEDAAQIAHKLVSTAGQFGLKKLSKLAKELEYAPQKNKESLIPIIRAMAGEFVRHAASLQSMKQ